MYIPKIAFEKFYEEITEFIWINCLSDTQREVLKKKEQKVWTVRAKGTNTSVFIFLFGNVDHNQDYFYQRSSEFRNNSCPYGFVNTDLMFTAFKHLEITIPQKLKHVTLAMKPYVLLQVFLEKHKKDDVLEKEKEFRLYNHDTNIVIDISGKLKEIKELIKKQKKPKKEDALQFALNDWSMENTDCFSPEEIKSYESTLVGFTLKYFQRLINLRYKDAFNMWQPAKRKEVWQDQLSLFEKDKYANPLVKNLHVWFRKIVPHHDNKQPEIKLVAKCRVFYSEIILVPSSQEFEEIQTSSAMKKPDDFINRLSILLERAKEHQLIHFYKFTAIKDLFTTDLMEKIRDTYSEKEISPVFPNVVKRGVDRVIDVYLVNEKDHWFISKIIRIKTDVFYPPDYI